MKGTS